MATEKNKTTKQNSKSNGKQSFWQSFVSFISDTRTHMALGIILLVATVYLGISMVSYFFTGSADDSLVRSKGMFDLTSLEKTSIQNWGGRFGAYFSNWIVSDGFGVASFFILAMVASVGLRLVGVRIRSLVRILLMMFCVLIWTSTAISFFFYDFYCEFINFGGDNGKYMSDLLENNVGSVGTFLIIVAFLMLFMIFFYQNSIYYMTEKASNAKSWFQGLFSKNVTGEFFDEGDNADNDKEDKSDSDTHVGVSESLAGSDDDNSEEHNDDEEVEHVIEVVEENEDANSDWNITAGPESSHTEDISDIPVSPVAPPVAASAVGDNVEFSVEAGGSDEHLVDSSEKDSENPVISYQQGNAFDEEDNSEALLEQFGPYDPTLDLSHYSFPVNSLLKDYGNEQPAINIEEQNANKIRITTTLQNYGIEITSIKATVGPTITLYEIVPKPGVRISKIKSLESDIMLSLAATGIRIIAPIPGKGTIGIEVPNENKQIVSMLSMVNSQRYKDAKEKYALPIAIGKTITNEVFAFDLAKAPHVLVAGATGQGKSVALNAIITSLLYAKHPAYLKFVMVDPKKVEFTLYSKIERQFLAKVPDEEEPIITDVTKVVQTLNSLTKEMDDRYTLLKKAQVRNIVEYNDKFIHRKLNPEKGHRFLPYIVVIIDEFGDLIMVAGKEVELPIARIAQLARAVGIHMIIATQRPSVNVITGIIKANFPTRIACRVTSVVDSRTVLDASGAQQLIGRGDLLFSKDGETTRVQCAFVDTPEVERVVDYIGNQQGYSTALILPEYDANVASGNYDGGFGGGGSQQQSSDIDPNERDPLFEEIAKMVVTSQQGSTSNIQRKFKIGFNRAGRIMDQLEAAGIVGPFEGSKQRQILVPDEYSLALKLHPEKMQTHDDDSSAE